MAAPKASHGMEEVGLLRRNDERLKATSGELKVIGRMETLKKKKWCLGEGVGGRWIDRSSIAEEFKKNSTP